MTLLLFRSCMDDSALWDYEHLHYKRPAGGVFILHEGNFTYDNASLSYYDPGSGDLLNEVFYQTNGLPLGDVAQSMLIRDSLAYIVVNNSGKVMVIDHRNFAFRGKITGLTSPRYMHFLSDEKAYVSDLYARAISVVNPRSFDLLSSIDVELEGGAFNRHSTEMMLQQGRYVFVNCWSFDNQILVIDAVEDRLVDSIRVGLQPNSMVMDRYGSIWVLCDGGYEGNPFGHEAPGLYRIRSGEKAAVQILRFDQADNPSELQITAGGDTLYFLNRDVYRMSVLASRPECFLPSPYGNSMTGGYYGLGIDPFSSEVYVADAIDFIQRGMVYRLSPRAGPLDTLRTGIVPSSFCFVAD